jgi:hypothetical protein
MKPSFPAKEKNTERVCQNREMRNVFGSGKEEEAGNERHNVEFMIMFFVQYNYCDETRRDVMGGTPNMQEGDKNLYKSVVFETYYTTSLGRLRRIGKIILHTQFYSL